MSTALSVKHAPPHTNVFILPLSPLIHHLFSTHFLHSCSFSFVMCQSTTGKGEDVHFQLHYFSCTSSPFTSVVTHCLVSPMVKVLITTHFFASAPFTLTPDSSSLMKSNLLTKIARATEASGDTIRGISCKERKKEKMDMKLESSIPAHYSAED